MRDLWRADMNELCLLKGHMWYYLARKEVIKEDGVYSTATKKRCSRCGLEEVLGGKS